MNFKIKHLLPLLVLFCSESFSDVQNKKNEKIMRSVTITPGFMERTFNSNEMMKYGPLSLMQVSSFGFDNVQKVSDNRFIKISLSLGYGAFNYILASMNNTVYHEFGHARAAETHGLSYYYGAASSSLSSNLRTDYAYGIYIQKLLHPSHILGGACTTFPEGYGALNTDQILTINAAGLNNQMRYAQEIADVIHDKNGHLLYAFDYVIAKLSSFNYVQSYKKELKNNNISSGNDIDHILKKYEDKNINITADDIKEGSLVSLFLSSTTWSFLYSAIFEVKNGSFLVNKPVWRRWRLPDVNFYMTTKGLSYEVITGFHFDDHWYAGLSYEFISKGNKACEGGPVVGYTFDNSYGSFYIKGQVIINQSNNIGGNIGVEWTSLDKVWSAGLKYIRHDGSTLVGERNIPFAKKGRINHETAISLSYNFG